MTSASLFWPLANHLWQSTLFVVVMWALSLALRRNQAAVRHKLWMTASLKFLFPYVLLTSAGNYLASLFSRPLSLPASVSYTIVEVSEPFVQSRPFVGNITSQIEPFGFAQVLPSLALFAWLAGALAVISVWAIRW